jgi:hypothetical protein
MTFQPYNLVPGTQILHSLTDCYEYTDEAEGMTYRVELQAYDTTDNTVYYETVEDAMSGEDARDMIDDKYPNRNVIAVIGKNNK